MSKISAVIITLNEAQKIERCLNSLKPVVDEIVVVDGYSSDETPEICRRHGARVLQCEWQGFAQSKNYGNRQARYDFILSIDSDEALSPRLQESIEAAKPQLSGLYEFNRLTNYCGQWIHHCGWYPDRKLRLFDRRLARWQGNFVHESVVYDSRTAVQHLTGDLWHYSFDSLSDHLLRVDKYSDLAARELLEKNKSGVWFKLLTSPAVKFFKCYVMQKGALDGFYGLCISAISAFDVFIRYAKLIQLRRKQ